MSTDAPTYWTVPAVAELLGVAPETVLTWLHATELLGVNVAQRRGRGRRPRWRIANSELERFLRARQTSPTPVVRGRRRREPEAGVFFHQGRPVGATV
jgi:hypothetical protein